VRAEQPSHPVEPSHGRVGGLRAEQLPQRHDQQVADGVLVQLAVAAEAVLDDVAPGLTPLVVAAQCGQRHAQVAGRQHAQLPAQPPAGPAVVGDGDDRAQPVGDPAQGRQGGVQPVTAAERDDPGSWGVHRAALLLVPDLLEDRPALGRQRP
jgi:hypothetical protein